jgi:hypothetical protein
MPGLIYCPHCRGALQDDGTLAGQSLICPRCHGRFDVPGPPPQFTPPASAYSTAISRRFQQSTSPFDILLDFRFEKYLTPLIIRATWIIALTASVIFVGIQFVTMVMEAIPVQEQAEKVQPKIKFGQDPFDMDKPADRFDTARLFGYFMAKVVGVILVLLWLRVSLEAVIVVFNMAESLVSIDKKTRE